MRKSHPLEPVVTTRYLAYKRRRPGVLGRFGVQQHFYSAPTATMLCELPTGVGRDRVRSDLVDFFQMGTEGAVLTVTVTDNAARDGSRDPRCRVYASPNDRVVGHEIVPLLYLGEHVQITMARAHLGPHPLQQQLTHLVGLLRAQHAEICRPLLLVLDGVDEVALSVTDSYRLRREVSEFLRGGQALLVMLEPDTVRRSHIAGTYAGRLRGSASLHFTGSGSGQDHAGSMGGLGLTGSVRAWIARSYHRLSQMV